MVIFGTVLFKAMWLLQVFLSRAKLPANCLLIALFGSFVAPANAAQSNGQFNVTVNVQSSANSLTRPIANGLVTPTTGFCTKELVMGTVVTIVCATGVVLDINESKSESDVPWVPANSAAYRFTRLTKDELIRSHISGEVNSFTEAGVIASWSVIDLPEYDYVEMQIGW